MKKIIRYRGIWSRFTFISRFVGFVIGFVLS